MAKIDRINDLPEWFDLSKYQGCETFGAAEWLEQVERRHDLLVLHPLYNERISQHGEQQWLEFALEFWALTINESAKRVRERPVDSPSKGKISEWMAHADNQPIRSVRVMDLVWQGTRDLEAERNGRAAKGISKRWAAINPSSISVWDSVEHATSPLSLNYYDEEGSHYSGGGNEIPIIQVDLGASDAALKEAFSTWLRGARAGQKKSSPKRGKPLYDRWARYGLLPYLDLKIWEMETDNDIPDRIMSAAISRYDAGESNLRKTVAPLADGLMRDLSEIKSLVAVEAASRVRTNPETFSS